MPLAIIKFINLDYRECDQIYIDPEPEFLETDEVHTVLLFLKLK